MHSDYQTAFPGTPVHEAPSQIVHLPEQTISTTEKDECRLVLKELNKEWEKRYQHTLSSAIPKLAPSENLTSKQTKSERKKTDRNNKRKVVAEINEKIGESTTITMLAEAESLGSYTRKRMSMSFGTPQVPNKRHKPHSPSDKNQSWSHEAAQRYLETFPFTRK